MKRLLAIAVIGLVACGGRQAIVPPDGRGTGSVALPDPVPALPAYLAELDAPLDGRRIEEVRRVRGVAVATEIVRTVTTVDGRKGRRRLTVGAVDPLAYRSLAPARTRAADFVWSSLLADAAVVSFSAGRELGLTEPGEIEIGGHRVAVGALADNGSDIDVLVSTSVGRRIGLGAARGLAIGARAGVSLDALRRRLEERLPGARLDRLATSSPKSVPEAVGHADGGLIGTMRYRILSNGSIEPDATWVAVNIVAADVPILGVVRCHRLMLPQLHAALAEIEERGLARLIENDQYGGCYVPRFIDRDPLKPLSMHAFGLAIDVNVSTNHLGAPGDLDPRVVAVFERWGFEWGGRWERPDPMHFELARLMEL